MFCGALVTICAALLLWTYREKVKALIARLRGTTPPTA